MDGLSDLIPALKKDPMRAPIADGTIRLSEGPDEYSGRVEVFDSSDGTWGTVCDADFVGDDNAGNANRSARVMCAQLGHQLGQVLVAKNVGRGVALARNMKQAHREKVVLIGKGTSQGFIIDTTVCHFFNYQFLLKPDFTNFND